MIANLTKGVEVCRVIYNHQFQFNQMKALHTFLICLLAISALTQVNESEANLYDWGKKKTELQPGYVILKSGKRMDGKISLVGSPGSVKQIMVLKEGSSEPIELSPESLKAYGLSISNAECETDWELFQWGMASTSTNAAGVSKQMVKSKSRNGYVILTDGKRVNGLLQIKMVNDAVSEIELESITGKNEYKCYDLKAYGLEVTMNDLTNNGKRVYKDESRNFHDGTITLNDGSVRKGYIAFKSRNYINNNRPSMGYTYGTPFFTASPTDIVMIFPTAEVTEITQGIGGVTSRFVPFDGGFVNITDLANLREKDPRKNFNKGELFMSDGSRWSGQLMQEKDPMHFYALSVMFKDDANKLTRIYPDQVLKFTQELEGIPTTFIPEQGTFVEEMFRGKTFILIRNPFPTTTNEFLTGLAGATASVGGQVAANSMVKKGKSEEDQQQFNDQINAMSTEELAATAKYMNDSRDDYQKMLQANGFTSEEAIKEYDRTTAAITTAMMGREVASAIDIKKKEWIFLNAQSKEKTIVTKDDYNKLIEPLLQSCEDYLLLPKSEQKIFKDFDNIRETIVFIDKCYNP